MPRNPRIHYPQAIYHVMSRGVEKRPIFMSDKDRRVFLRFLDEAVRADLAALFAYCLMGNHYHLLIAINEIPLAVTMQKALTRYALYFNRTHDRVGHLFQSRYTAMPCQDLAYLIHLVAYIHMNPVRAGLAAHPADWAWSSHGELAGGSPRYLALGRLEESVGMAASELRQCYIDRLASLGDQGIQESPQLEELIGRAALTAGVVPKDILGGRRGKVFTKAKRLLIDWAGKAGFSDVELARTLGCDPSALAHLRKRSCQFGA